MTKDTALYALSMIISTALERLQNTGYYEEDMVTELKERTDLERIYYHAETIKKYLEESK